MDLMTAVLTFRLVQPVELLGHDAALLRAEHAFLDEEAILVERPALSVGEVVVRHAELTKCLLRIHAPPPCRRPISAHSLW